MRREDEATLLGEDYLNEKNNTVITNEFFCYSL